MHVEELHNDQITFLSDPQIAAEYVSLYVKHSNNAINTACTMVSVETRVHRHYLVFKKLVIHSLSLVFSIRNVQ